MQHKTLKVLTDRVAEGEFVPEVQVIAEWATTDTITVEIPGGLKVLLERQALESKSTLDSYVSMLLVKGSYKR